MTVVAIDFETYYDKDYSLSKLSEVEYILHPQFQTIMCAVKIGEGPSETFVGEEAVADRFSQIDWSKAALLSHNTRFDGAILAWRYGITPAMYLDTLSMARATTHWLIGKSSLKAVSDYLRLPPKGTEVVQAKGKRLEDFSHAELQAYRHYCERDNDNCYDIFKVLRPNVKNDELLLIDIVLRMFIEPQVELDAYVLQQHLADVQARKAEILLKIDDMDKSMLASNNQFAAQLTRMGINVPMKKSPTTGELIPAVARNDWAFKELCANEDLPLEVQALLAARLSVKSTLEESRTASLLRLRQLTPKAPVPLKYSGARTHRLSGDGGTNWQNIQRGSQIRAAICAPEGFRIVHRDASQIEARMVAWMADCSSLLEAFGAGRDVYSEFASTVYSRLITREDKLERFVGKTGILGLGYGCGAMKFRHMLYIGNGGVSVKETEAFAQKIVYRYRDTYPEIPQLWSTMRFLLDAMIDMRLRKEDRVEYTQRAAGLSRLPIEPGKQGDCLWLPNGLALAYPDLRREKVEETGMDEIVYKGIYGTPQRIYGAKCVENLSQALARIVVTDIAVRMRRETTVLPFLSTHDSLDYVVPASDAAALDAELERQFAVRPSWAPDLPLASEGGWGKTLAQAEKGVND